MHSSLLPYRPERDAYVLLGIPSTASTDEVNAACRRLARTFHPDRNGSDRATAEMAVVNAVRQVMVDPDARAAYDHERRSFHELRARSIVRERSEVPVLAVGPPSSSGPGTVARYASGVTLGLLAAARALLPPRCPGCHEVLLSGADAFCASCGTPLRAGG
jgi:curved DNA-binding protein CbpA